MDVVRGHPHCPVWASAAVAIGNFDGVHVGHRALIDRARELAAPGAKTVVLTFDPHPSSVLTPQSPRVQLASLPRRLELLAAAGCDAVVIESFSAAYAALAAAPFIDDVVIGALHARAIVVGYDFIYGSNRGGTTETLAAHCARLGVELAIVPPVEIDGEVASSTRLRQLLRVGELARANRMLGRPWDVDGIVVHGAKRGRAIGIPTANIVPSSDLVIAPGIYAVTLSVEGGPERLAVASLGTNPTFVAQGGLVLEVHVLDYDGDLYNRHVRTTFVARLRNEEKYDSIDALLTQIHRDIAEARTALAAR